MKNSTFLKFLCFSFTISVIILVQSVVYALPTGFHVYFNDAPHSSANGIDDALVDFIDSADETVDGAFYSIGRTKIVDAFINAASRLGPDKVRIITDHSNSSTSSCQKLIAAGITVIDETWDDEMTPSEADSMISHNKFCIVDHKKLWTGSYNITDSGTIYNNNNAVAIDCEDVALAYLAEFNEMWGSSTATPGDCHFSTQKQTQISHHYTCNGVPVDVYFSPTKDQYPDRAIDVIQEMFTAAQSSLHFCIFAFTSYPIALKVIAAYEAGKTVQGVFDNTQAGYSSSRFDFIQEAGVDVILDNTVTPHANFLHHKYAVIDHGLPQAAVIGGSYNWSLAAQYDNDENTIIIHNEEIAELYYYEFYRCYYGVDPEPPKDLEITIESNETDYSAGTYLRVWTTIDNPEKQRLLDEYIILDLGAAFGDDRFYFWPNWTTTPESKTMYLNPDDNFEQTVFDFVLPSPLSAFGPMFIYAGLVDPNTGQLAADYDFIEFSFK